MRIEENITIAIPVYERYEFFEDAVNSAVNQTIHCNVIIVDNCSSHDKFECYVKKLNLGNVNYFRNKENLGAIGNWNKCIEYCKTDWISILHSDDMLSPFYIESILSLILNNREDYAFLVGNEVGEYPLKIYSTPQKIVYTNTLKANVFLFGNYAGFPGNIFNKNKIPLKFEELKGASDYFFWYSMAKLKPLILIKNILAFYRMSSEQDSANMNIEEVVIKPVYLVRRDRIGFKNSIVKFISLYELFDLYRYYQKNYGKHEEDIISLSIDEINQYFNFFNKKIVKTLVHPFCKFIRFVIRRIY